MIDVDARLEEINQRCAELERQREECDDQIRRLELLNEENRLRMEALSLRAERVLQSIASMRYEETTE